MADQRGEAQVSPRFTPSKPFREGRLWEAGIAVLLGLMASLPLGRGLLPEAHDALFHLFRLVQLDELVRAGVLYARWAPELAYGYGYPLFNFYGPGVYYVAQVFRLLGVSFSHALLLTSALALGGASVAMYLWVRDLCDGPGALVAAAVYVLAPYLAYNLLYRAALAELLALALLPLILHGTLRLARTGRARYALLAGGAYAALLLTHNIGALLFTPVLLLYSALLIAAGEEGERRQTVARLWPLLVLSLGMTAFFWIPALAEQRHVRIEQLYVPEDFNFVANFLGRSELLALPRAADPRLVNQVEQSPPLTLGLAALPLALLSLLRRGGAREEKLFIAFGWVGLLGALFMTLPASRWLWERLPLIRFVQFPWRFLGFAALFLALLAGWGSAVLFSRCTRTMPARGGLLALLLAMQVLYLLPWQYVRYYPPLESVTMLDSARFERRSGSVGTTTTGEYLPRAVQALPVHDSPALESGERLAPASLPEGARVVAATYNPLRYRVTVESPVAFELVFQTFDFPGWKARIAGAPVPITPTVPEGFISVTVPEGRQEIEIWFGSTPVRTAATVLSVGSLLTFGGWLIFLARKGASGAVAQVEPALSGRASSMALVVLLGLVAFKVFCVDVEDCNTPFRRTRFDGERVAGVDVPLHANFGNRLLLLGLDHPLTLLSDSRAEVALYWRVQEAVETEYSVGLFLVDERGIRYGVSEHQHPGGYPPTTQWRPHEYARDPHVLRLLPGTPPGSYTLQVSVYPYGEPEQALDLLNESDAPVGRLLIAAELTVQRPAGPPSLAALAPTTTTLTPLSEGLTLVGYDLPQYVGRPGEELPLTLYWEATGSLPPELEVRFSLLDAADLVTEVDAASPVPGYPTGGWRPGDRWRGEHRLLLPPALESGSYLLRVAGGEGAAVPLGRLSVTAPERLLEPPPVGERVNIVLGEVAQLYGHDLPADMPGAGRTLTVTLVWRAEGETRQSYKSFVHLLRPDGTLAAGSDAVPAAWQRPTTGWMTGEYVVDTHQLTLPPELLPGVYQLQAGLYDERSGIRLITAEGKDVLPLGTLEVP